MLVVGPFQLLFQQPILQKDLLNKLRVVPPKRPTIILPNKPIPPVKIGKKPSISDVEDSDSSDDVALKKTEYPITKKKKEVAPSLDELQPPPSISYMDDVPRPSNSKTSGSPPPPPPSNSKTSGSPPPFKYPYYNDITSKKIAKELSVDSAKYLLEGIYNTFPSSKYSKDKKGHIFHSIIVVQANGTLKPHGTNTNIANRLQERIDAN